MLQKKVRLNEHCSHFKEVLKEEESGKKLGFITQEMGREINTLGSKANNINIQKLCNMKDGLEKLKNKFSISYDKNWHFYQGYCSFCTFWCR